MSLVCNVEQQTLPPTSQTSDPWADVYRENEKFVESGSAYFSQAFAEALGLVADIELHDVQRAELRLQAMSALLAAAMEQYERGMDIDSQTGLLKHHEERLREIGLNREGTTHTLEVGRQSGFIGLSDSHIHDIASILTESGYGVLMSRYLEMVQSIETLVDSEMHQQPDSTQRDWQGAGWRITTAFTATAQFGQAIAVVNAAAYR